ncbi:unnamed protein product [Effrenium voratum]|uniref:DNA-(apurinic or apyrimidinic site) lyase n=1 Tax=Effrenium voratum TaxID=2562239 RepID=A0AA36NFY5_9DINO|nr:unnamed protein product [Effrenium voratum]CAJ1405607.1 unnamed protein product [Effrenium voratum]CAJ1416208.1 unnamed protein product [Effrenium voratum]
MVEGDGCHRIAAQHRKQLVGRRMTARSPNGRFKSGAQAIVKCGGVLLKIEVHGKNMFYFFGSKAGGMIVVHVHFGMAGAFAVYKGEEPEISKNVRLRLATVDSGAQLVAHLSAMIVKHGKPAMYTSLTAKLGADPLREDADPEQVVAAFGCNKPVGTVLVDQSVCAGVGNIYRTEILYEARIHPKQPANTLTLAEILKLWNVAVKQMQAGFTTGSIWGTKRNAFCYGKRTSSCGGKVKQFNLGGRAVYACSKRQQLDSKKAAATKLRRPGTSHLDSFVAAVKAEAKKRRTGEGLGVQHVALKDDATRAAQLAAKKRPSARR